MLSRLRYGWGIEGACTRDDKGTFFCKKGPHHTSTLYHLGGLHNVRTTPTATATLLYEFSRYALDLGESRDLLTANVSMAPKIAGRRPVAVEDPCLLCSFRRQTGGVPSSHSASSFGCWLAFLARHYFLCVSSFNGSIVNGNAGASYRSHFGTLASEEVLHY